MVLTGLFINLISILILSLGIIIIRGTRAGWPAFTEARKEEGLIWRTVPQFFKKVYGEGYREKLQKFNLVRGYILVILGVLSLAIFWSTKIF